MPAGTPLHTHHAAPSLQRAAKHTRHTSPSTANQGEARKGRVEDAVQQAERSPNPWKVLDSTPNTTDTRSSGLGRWEEDQKYKVTLATQ